MARFLHRISALLLALWAGALFSVRDVRADELFVMPYACKVAGGRLILTPSHDQGHPVIGRRQQEEFRACSPENPHLCRRWNIHRFDLDCSGTRVPWIDVAAAAAAQEESVDGTNAFVSGGHFELEMPPRWSLLPDDPCAGPDDDAGRWGVGVRRFCGNRLARVPRVTVTMPRGFAPMLGIDGIFVKDDARPGPVAEAPWDGPSGGRDTMANSDERSADTQSVAPPAPVKKPTPKEPPVTEKATSPPVKTPTASVETSTSRATTLAVPPSEPKPEEPSKKPEAPTGTGSAAAELVIPTIINGSSGGKTEPSSTPKEAKKDDAADAAAEVAQSPTELPTDVTALPPSGDPVTADGVAGDRSDTSSLTTSPLSAGLTSVLSGDKPIVIAAGIALLALTLLAAVLLRRGGAAGGEVIARDIASVSFDPSAPVKTAEPTLRAVPVVVEPVSRHTEPTLDEPPGAPSVIGDSIPKTREDALRVLGIGVSPDVSEAAIKKIIDGLRLSWHPDHARDAEDRKVRELRVRQINVAWDILAGRGAA